MISRIKALPGAVTRFRSGYRFLSNFWVAPVVWEGREYATVEHAYQAAKLPDEEYRKRVQACATPGEAKREGRGAEHRRTEGPHWEDWKLSVMGQLVMQKFSKHAHLREALLRTGDRELIEGNSWGDGFWGKDERTGQGENHLGQILMAVRLHLRRLQEEEGSNERIGEP